MLKNLNFFALFLAFLVVLMFIGIGIAIAKKDFLMIVLCIIIAFAIMGYGISLSKRSLKK